MPSPTIYIMAKASVRMIPDTKRRTVPGRFFSAAEQTGVLRPLLNGQMLVNLNIYVHLVWFGF